MFFKRIRSEKTTEDAPTELMLIQAEIKYHKKRQALHEKNKKNKKCSSVMTQYYGQFVKYHADTIKNLKMWEKDIKRKNNLYL
jgi:hypothetical protein